MANNYYEATGVLVLDRVTPVIQALFSAFALDESHPGNGQAYIAQIAGPPIRNGRTCSMAWKTWPRNSAFRCRTTKGFRSRRCSNCSPCTSVPMRTKSWGT